jgi:hypothetical protein
VTNSFNPYREWLELDPGLNQPNYYEVLKIDSAESSHEVIAMAADRAMSKVRGCRPGQHAALWAKLLDELKNAKSCLLDAAKRAEYDRSLRQPKSAVASLAPPSSAAAPIAATAPDTFTGGAADPMMPRAVPTAPRSAPAGASPWSEGGGDDAPITRPQPSSYAWQVPAPAPAPVPAPTPVQPYAAPSSSASPYGQTAPTSYPQSPYPYSPQGAPVTPQMQSPAGQYYAAPTSYNASQDPMAPMGSGSPYSSPTSYPHSQPQYGANPQGAGGWSQQYAAPSNPAASEYSQYPQYPQQYPNTHAPYGGSAAPDPWAANDPMAPITPVGPMTPSGPMYGVTPLAEPAFGVEHDPMAPIGGGAPTRTASPVFTGGPAGVPMGRAVTPSVAPATTYAPFAAPGLAVAPAPGSAAAGPSVATPSLAAAPSTSKMASERSQPSWQTPIAIAVAAGLVLLMAAALYAVYGTGQKPETPPAVAQDRDPELVPGKTTNPLYVTPPVQPRPEPVPQPQPPLIPPTQPETNPMPVPTPPDPTPQPAPQPEPQPVPKPVTPPAVTPTPQELMALSQALKTARLALSERNLDDADAELAKAELLAKLPEHKAKVARLKDLAYYVREFWKAVGKGLEGLTGGDEIKIGSTYVAVVEVAPTYVIIRLAGTNRRYNILDLPTGLVMAFADRSLNQNDSTTGVFKGAYYAVDKKEDSLANARRLWQEAISAGIDVKELLTVLDDTYDFASGPPAP